MRILDEELDKSVGRITLYLTSPEAQELVDSLRALLAGNGTHHEHISSSDFQKELTVTLYDVQSIETYDDRSKRLIEYDE